MATLSQAGIAGVGNGVLHPKHKNRWRVLFQGLGGTLGSTAGGPNDLSLQVVTVTRPSISYEEVQLDRYNTRIYVAGKHTFEPCTMTVEDDVTNRATAAIQTQMERQQRLIGASGPWLNSEGTAFGYKFGMVLEMLDGNEAVAEAWKYEGCYLSALDYTDLDYSTGEKVTITLTIRFDHARQTLTPAVVGTAIGGLVQG